MHTQVHFYSKTCAKIWGWVVCYFLQAFRIFSYFVQFSIRGDLFLILLKSSGFFSKLPIKKPGDIWGDWRLGSRGPPFSLLCSEIYIVLLYKWITGYIQHLICHGHGYWLVHSSHNWCAPSAPLFWFLNHFQSHPVHSRLFALGEN